MVNDTHTRRRSGAIASVQTFTFTSIVMVVGLICLIVFWYRLTKVILERAVGWLLLLLVYIIT